MFHRFEYIQTSGITHLDEFTKREKKGEQLKRFDTFNKALDAQFNKLQFSNNKKKRVSV